MDKKQPYWFKRRRYGWGWIPVTWQGWLVVALYLVLVIGGGSAFWDAPEEVRSREIAIYSLGLLLATTALIRVGYAKGPKPRWRWGKEPNDNPKEDF